jgi:hypothetical protein
MTLEYYKTAELMIDFMICHRKFCHMKTKAYSIRAIQEFVKTRFGQKGYQKWVESLPQQSQEIYQGFLGNAWYPEEWAKEVPMTKICELFYDGDKRGARDVGRNAARYVFNGAYRSFLKTGSPEFTLSVAKILWKEFFDAGTFEIIRLGNNAAKIRVSDLPERYPVWEEGVAGTIEGAFDEGGVKKHKVTITNSVFDGRNPGILEIMMEWE